MRRVDGEERDRGSGGARAVTLHWQYDQAAPPAPPPGRLRFVTRRRLLVAGALLIGIAGGVIAWQAWSRQHMADEVRRHVLAVAELEQRAYAADDAELLVPVMAEGTTVSERLSAIRAAEHPLRDAHVVGGRGQPLAAHLSATRPAGPLDIATVDVRLTVSDTLGTGRFIMQRRYAQRANGQWRAAQPPRTAAAPAITSVARDAVTVTLTVNDRARLEPALSGLAAILAAWCADQRAAPERARSAGAATRAERFRRRNSCPFHLYVHPARRDVTALADPASFLIALPPPALRPDDGAAQGLVARHLARQVIRQASGDRPWAYSASGIAIGGVLREALLNQWLARAAPGAAWPPAAGERTYADLQRLFPGTVSLAQSDVGVVERAARRLAADVAPLMTRPQLAACTADWRLADTLGDWLAGCGIDLAHAEALMAPWAGAPAPFPPALPLLIVSRNVDRTPSYALALPGRRFTRDVGAAACDGGTALAASWRPRQPELVVACAERSDGPPGEAAIIRLGLTPEGDLQRRGSARQVGPMQAASDRLAVAARGEAVAWWDTRNRLALWPGQPGAAVQHIATDFSTPRVDDPAYAVEPVWSPDGARLAYQSSLDPSRWAVLVPGEPAPRWQADGATAIWSPDGGRLILGARSGGAFSLSVHDARSGRMVQQVDLPNWRPSAVPSARRSAAENISVSPGGWSPDGQWLGFLYLAWPLQATNGPDATAMAAWNAATGQVNLMPLPEPTATLTWQPGTTRLTATPSANRRGDGGAVAFVWDVTGDRLAETPPAASSWSPDGRWVAASTSHGVSVYRPGSPTELWHSEVGDADAVGLRWQE